MTCLGRQRQWDWPWAKLFQLKACENFLQTRRINQSRYRPFNSGLAQRVQRSPLLPVNLPCMQSCCAILSHNFAHLPYALAMLPVRLALLSVESAWLASCVAHQNAALAVLPYGFAIMNDATVDVPLPMTKLTFSLAAVSPNLFDLAWSTASQCAAFSSPTT